MKKSKGICFIISAPSGAGKSSIAKYAIENDANLWLSVSATTRDKRPKEIDGVDYYFFDRQAYLEIQEKGDLIESSEIYGNFYGTLKSTVFTRLARGVDIIFDIDWQGSEKFREIKEIARQVRIFILPPSISELQARLVKRGDKPESIALRIEQAKSDCSHYDKYDYVLVNKDLHQVCSQVTSIIQVERLRLANLDQDLIKEIYNTEP
jgi:guanylate kinase